MVPQNVAPGTRFSTATATSRTKGTYKIRTEAIETRSAFIHGRSYTTRSTRTYPGRAVRVGSRRFTWTEQINCSYRWSIAPRIFVSFSFILPILLSPCRWSALVLLACASRCVVCTCCLTCVVCYRLLVCV